MHPLSVPPPWSPSLSRDTQISSSAPSRLGRSVGPLASALSAALITTRGPYNGGGRSTRGLCARCGPSRAGRQHLPKSQRSPRRTTWLASVPAFSGACRLWSVVLLVLRRRICSSTLVPRASRPSSGSHVAVDLARPLGRSLLPRAQRPSVVGPSRPASRFCPVLSVPKLQCPARRSASSLSAAAFLDWTAALHLSPSPARTLSPSDVLSVLLQNPPTSRTLLALKLMLAQVATSSHLAPALTLISLLRLFSLPPSNNLSSRHRLPLLCRTRWIAALLSRTLVETHTRASSVFALSFPLFALTWLAATIVTKTLPHTLNIPDDLACLDHRVVDQHPVNRSSGPPTS